MLTKSHITSVSSHLEGQNVNVPIYFIANIWEVKHFTHVLFFDKQKDSTQMIFKLFENKYPCCWSNMILTSSFLHTVDFNYWLLLLFLQIYIKGIYVGFWLFLDNIVIVISCILSFSFFFRWTIMNLSFSN